VPVGSNQCHRGQPELRASPAAPGWSHLCVAACPDEIHNWQQSDGKSPDVAPYDLRSRCHCDSTLRPFRASASSSSASARRIRAALCSPYSATRRSRNLRPGFCSFVVPPCRHRERVPPRPSRCKCNVYAPRQKARRVAGLVAASSVTLSSLCSSSSETERAQQHHLIGLKYVPTLSSLLCSCRTETLIAAVSKHERPRSNET
jgi:hypothetical protein